jgi:hypothetical protein
MMTSDTHNQRIANMTFASVYPMYVAKVEKKGRTEEELLQVITWLTGFSFPDESPQPHLKILSIYHGTHRPSKADRYER